MIRPQISNTSSPTGPVDLDDFDRAVLATLEMLPFRQAEAIWLVDVCGTTYADGAQTCGMSRRRFERHLHAGRKAILRSVSGS